MRVDAFVICIATVALMIAGCSTFPADCGNSPNPDVCCEETMENMSHIQCLGSWKYIEGQGCVFECETEPIGGERDEYGCLVSAGYSWDEETTACIRAWEFDDDRKKAADIAMSPLSYRTTAISVDALRCPGCFIVNLERNDSQNRFSIKLYNWTIAETINEDDVESFEDCAASAYPVMESYYPRQCKTPWGDTFTEDVMDEELCSSEGGRTVNIVEEEACGEDEINAGSISSVLICCIPRAGEPMTFEEAFEIASESLCVYDGTLSEEGTYNSYSDTWWIDIEPFEDMSGCSPACVVSEYTGTAETNWRCGGLSD